jgi:hypothetical protein
MTDNNTRQVTDQELLDRSAALLDRSEALVDDVHGQALAHPPPRLAKKARRLGIWRTVGGTLQELSERYGLWALMLGGLGGLAMMRARALEEDLVDEIAAGTGSAVGTPAPAEGDRPSASGPQPVPAAGPGPSPAEGEGPPARRRVVDRPQA